MKTSEQTTDLLTALCAARLVFPVITRNRDGFSKRTGQKYQYADLNALIDGTTPTLGQHGLILIQALEDGEGGTLRITSTLFHAASGQWVSSELSVTKPDNMQDFGSVATYAKRYAQQALLNVSTEEDDDSASLNGSSKADKPTAIEKRPAEPVSTNGHTPEPGPDASLEHPTESHLAALKNLACTECAEPVDVYEDRLRTTMKIPKQASVSPRLLTKTMSMTTYMEVYGYYVRLEAQLAKSRKEIPGANDSTPPVSSQPTPPPTGEGLPVDPSTAASSSALESAEVDAAERDRVRLRAEVAQWDLRVPPEEVEHVIQHNVYSKARALLWKCRRKGPAATPIEAAAD